MRIFLFLFVFILSACDSQQVSEFAQSPGVKQLAQVGADVIESTVSVLSTEQTDSEPRPKIHLVHGSKAIGFRNFDNAKKVLPAVFAGMEEEFYCGCKYTGKSIDWQSCGYIPRKNPERASRLEWEHVVPAWVIGHQRQCWQQGGRKNCSENDPVFQAAEGDLNNLVPSIGEVNGDRSNFSYGAWASKPSPMYGQCQTIIDFKNKRAQPREEVRGSAARITLYMHQQYGLAMSKQDKQLMCAWARQYPVDDWERQRDQRIVRKQGRGNPLVSDPEQIKAQCT